MSGQNFEKRLGTSVAEEVRVLLARRRISAVQLAKLMGVSQPYLSRRLNGAVPLNLDDIEAIAHVLGVEIGDLMPRTTKAGGGDFKDLYLPFTRTADVERVSPHSPSPIGRSGRAVRAGGTGPKSRDRVKGRRPPHQRPTVLPT